jgi:DNA processing protein
MPKKPPPLTTRELVALRLAAPASRSLFQRLLFTCGGLRGVLEASVAELMAAPRLEEPRARRIHEARAQDEAIERELELIGKYGVRVLSFEDTGYPAALREAPVPPPILYARGTARLDDRAVVAIVGARSPTQYGLSIARSLGRGMARAGVGVVSGLAQGIDDAAMTAAVEAGGKVLGVLGCGLSIIYPASARDLVPRLLEEGALLSEYPMETKPLRGNFPERNSIIAGLALGTVVVEAAEKSGSLITAECALEAGRSIFAVPGDITRENSRGANRLIQSGAKLVMDTNDILRELAPRLKDALRERTTLIDGEANGAAGRGEAAEAGGELTERGARDAAGDGARAIVDDNNFPADLTPLERALLERITHEEQPLDALMADAAVASGGPSALSMALLQLELRGLVRKSAGGLYLRIF